MDVAVVNPKFASPHLGGGITSLLTLLEGAHEEYDLSVDAYQTPPVERVDLDFEYEATAHESPTVPVFHWVDQAVTARNWERYLSNEIDDRYDLVVGQDILGVSAMPAADRHDVPSLLFIRSMISTGYYQYTPAKSHLANLRRADLGGRLQYPFVLQNHRYYRRNVVRADTVVANSEFTAECIGELYGADPAVVYPPIDLDGYRTDHDPGGHVTMVNPRDRNKGGDIFLDIAAEMDDETFLMVGEAPDELRERAERLDNVTYLEWCDDMRDVYSQSKVVLVPTRTVETFGRVAAEAMVSGIPCVVSDRGGLPFVVGDTGYVVEDVEDVGEWVEKIRTARSDDRSGARRDRAEREFSAETQVDRFARLIADLVE